MGRLALSLLLRAQNGATKATPLKMNREHRVSTIHLTRGHRVLARHAPANMTVFLGTDVAQ